MSPAPKRPQSICLDRPCFNALRAASLPSGGDTFAKVALVPRTALSEMAGPILGLVLTAAALHGANLGTSLLLLTYALGAASSFAVVLLIGWGDGPYIFYRISRSRRRGLCVYVRLRDKQDWRRLR